MEEEGDLYLDVNCSHGAVGFSIMLRLTADEAAVVRSGGKEAVDVLAVQIRDHATMISPTRNLSSVWQQKSLEAIRHWRSKQQA